jgi:hypothetical protein
MNKRDNRILNRVEVKLFTWFWYLIHQDLPVSQKEVMWRKSLEYFLRNHSTCDHETSDKRPLITALEMRLIRAVAGFLEETERYFDVVVQGAFTHVIKHLVHQRLDLPSNTLCGRIHGQDE